MLQMRHKRLFERRFEVMMDDCGCWEWTGFTNGHGHGYGYGRFNQRVKGRTKNWQAHRYSYELYVGPIPPGKLLLHSCDNRTCVNPRHLRPGTQSENMLEAYQRGRAVSVFCPGQQHHNARLTDAEIEQILASNERQHILAARYSTTQGYISQIKSGHRRSKSVAA